MILLVDAGNTALKWATLDAAGHMAPARTELHRGVGDLRERLSTAWHELPSGPALACSVAAPAVRDVVERAAAEGGRSLQWLGSEVRHDGRITLFNRYRTPMQLGADRWHGMLGACARRPGLSFVLVTAGTATTVNCVHAAASGAEFVGGCIAPGRQLMLDALAQRTADLPQARGTTVDFPDNTDDAIITGVVDAQAGLAQRLVDRFARRLGAAPAVLVSGGDAEAVANALRAVGIDAAVEHNLVLAGLALRAERPGLSVHR